MKKVVFGIAITLGLLSIILIATILLKSPEKEVQRTNKLIVSILPLKYLVQKIVDDDYLIEVLVPPGSSPETYEPTPQQLISISNAELIFTVGLIDFENELIGKSAKYAENKIVTLSKDIALLSGCCGHAMDHHGHQHSGIDPHVWTSPKHLKIMANNAYNAVVALPSPNKEKYADNYKKLIVELEELDHAVREMIADANIKCFFIYHPAMTYYADCYGLKQVAIEREGKEPSADHLRNLIDIAKNEKIKTILYQREFSKYVVETVAKDIGATPVEINPLAENITESIMQITRLITENN